MRAISRYFQEEQYDPDLSADLIQLNRALVKFSINPNADIQLVNGGL
jgi:hypothetical protein